MGDNKIILHCWKCKSILVKSAVLPIGTEFVMRCRCGKDVYLLVDQRMGLKMWMKD